MNWTVQDLKSARDAGAEFLLLDVRTEEELGIVRLDPCVHIPLHELEGRTEELAAWRDKPVVCLCHHGGRSAMAQQHLRAAGFSEAYNLIGGIDAYAEAVDGCLARY